MVSINKDKFKIIGYDENELEAISRPNISYWKDAWRRLRKNKVAMVSLVILIIVILMCLIGPYLSPFNFKDQDYSLLDKTPTTLHWFGTDNLGRDMFVRTWMGGRISMYIGFVGTLVELVIGCLYGGIAGYLGGKADMIMMRLIEIIASVPYLLVVILLLLVLPKGVNTLIIGLCITGWVGIARLIRGQVMQIKSLDYVLAAKALGAKPMRIILKHELPNTVGLILVYMSMDIPAFIFDEAF